MYNRRYKLFIPALLIVAMMLVNPLNAEDKQSYNTVGNNVGLIIKTTGNGGPLGGNVPHQWPRGSGNIIQSNIWNWGVNVVRDSDGDGSIEDTLKHWNRGSGINGSNNSEQAYDALAAAAAAGDRLGQVSKSIQVNRVWASTDAADLADWPSSFREGRTSSGDPIVNGAETVVTYTGNAFAGDYPTGASMEHAFYFLNFGKSNDMVYHHMLLQNMSEYLKWNDDDRVTEKIASQPDGQVWAGFQITYSQYRFYFGAEDRGWAFHNEKEITVKLDKSGDESSFSGPTPMQATRVINPIVFKDQEAELLAHNATGFGGREFGFNGYYDLLQGSGDTKKQYRMALGREMGGPVYDWPNPWSDVNPLYGWPGRLFPEDARYEEWLWGDDGPICYTYWGELHDFAPRDTLIIDAVYMFVLPANIPFQIPASDIANLSNEANDMVQVQLAPIETYADVARTVFGGNFVLPETPVAPPLTIIPGDRQVSITWSDVNINTEDAYWHFLQENPELDPNQDYTRYDFEGFRLYRSYSGPSATHQELIWEGSIGSNSIAFSFIDKWDDDEPLYRLTNGLKVWYALVPYDKNIDPSTGATFSLPTLESGKNWNRPGAAGLYNVLSRSDASNYKSASWNGTVTFTPAYGTPTSAEIVTVAGNGDGTFAEPPPYRAPVVEFDFEAVINERITTAKTLVVAVADGWTLPTSSSKTFSKIKFQLSEGGIVASESPDAGVRDYSGRPGDVSPSFYSAVHSAGVDYTVSADFKYLSEGNFRNDMVINLDMGGYSGATTRIASTHSSRKMNYPPGMITQMRTGRFTITWGAAGVSSVTDVTRGGKELPFVEFPDDYGWGLVSLEAFGGSWGSNSKRGQLYDDLRKRVPRADRTSKMVASLPAGNTEEFGLWVNGVLWLFEGTDGVIGGMPASGTVMTMDNAWGEWNSDKTEFDMFHEPPWPGDSWTLDILPSSLNPEDADLSKIRVVPNPYLANSFLDLSPSSRRIEFVNLPDRCTIRIYTVSGNLVNVFNHIGNNRHGWGNFTDMDRLDADSQPKVFEGYDNHSGTEPWNLTNRFGQTVASGLYLYHVTDSRGEEHTGKFYIIN